MGFSGANGAGEPGNAVGCTACERTHMLQRLQVAAREKACEDGAILQPDTER
jgi:hypothetical protein